MHPVKQILLGSVIGMVLGLIIAVSVPHYEIVEPKPYVSTYEPAPRPKVAVYEGTIGDQKVVLTQKEIEGY